MLTPGTPVTPVAAGAVRTWIKDGPVELTADVVRARITELGLSLPADAPAAIHVHLLTIKDQCFDIEPDYRLDWRDYFGEPGNEYTESFLLGSA